MSKSGKSTVISLPLQQRHFYTVSGKKRSIFFCNNFYKTQAILMKFGVWFPE